MTLQQLQQQLFEIITLQLNRGWTSSQQKGRHARGF